jgi:CDP-diacylglycerol--glycerol-3-phosphate 3-phosphatidyltransferase
VLFLALGALTLFLAFALLLSTSNIGALVLAWLLASFAGIGYVFLVVWRRLTQNHRADENFLLPELGIGTAVTILRGVLLALLGGFLFLPPLVGILAWLPGLLYLLAGIADYLDGYLARKTNHSTVLGQALDLDLDAFGILVAPLLAVVYNKLPVWYLLVSLSRYLFAGGIRFVERAGKPSFELTPSTRRRQWAGFQMGFIGIILLPIYTFPATWVAATVFMTPFLLGFLRDWLIVSGSVDASSILYQQFVQQTRKIAFEVLPVVFRIFAVGSTWTFLATRGMGDSLLPALFSIPLLSILIGSLGRTIALATLLWVGWLVQDYGVDFVAVAAIGSLSALVILGTGALSIWQPEEEILNYRAGVLNG